MNGESRERNARSSSLSQTAGIAIKLCRMVSYEAATINNYLYLQILLEGDPSVVNKARRQRGDQSLPGEVEVPHDEVLVPQLVVHIEELVVPARDDPS